MVSDLHGDVICLTAYAMLLFAHSDWSHKPWNVYYSCLSLYIISCILKIFNFHSTLTNLRESVMSLWMCPFLVHKDPGLGIQVWGSRLTIYKHLTIGPTKLELASLLQIIHLCRNISPSPPWIALFTIQCYVTLKKCFYNYNYIILYTLTLKSGNILIELNQLHT